MTNKTYKPQEEAKIREEFRRAVIMGCHPGKTYEEALEKELNHGCRLTLKTELFDKQFEGIFIVEKKSAENLTVTGERGQGGPNVWITCGDINEILGLPITIGRVMAALKRVEHFSCDEYFKYYDRTIVWDKTDEKGVTTLHFVGWQLLREDGSECTDEDQDIEVLSKLLNLLTK